MKKTFFDEMMKVTQEERDTMSARLQKELNEAIKAKDSQAIKATTAKIGNLRAVNSMILATRF